MDSNKILISQKDIGKEIRKRHESFNQLAAERKNMEFLKGRLQWLEDAWARYVENDTALKNATDIDGGHEYYTNEYSKHTYQHYLQYQNEIKSTMQKLVEAQQANTERENANGTTSSWVNGQDNPNTMNTNVKDFFKRAALNISADQTKAMVTMDELMDSLKAAITNMQDVKKAPRSQQAAYYKVMVNKWETIQKMHDQVIAYPDYDVKPYLELEEKMFEILVESEKLKETQQVQRNQQGNGSSAKLPKLEIPKFKGEYTKYISFRQLFTKMVGNNNQLDDCEKFAYLKGQLEGKALTIITHLAIEDASYNTAWRILDNRYDNKHVIFTELFNKVLKLEPMSKNSDDAMRTTVDTITECVTSLENMGMEMTDYINHIFYNLLDSKLDGRTRNNYENSLEEPASMRRYDHLMAFLNTKLQNVRNVHETKTYSKNTNKRNAYVNNRTTTALNATKAESKNEAAHCECKEKHKLNNCKAFIDATPEERFATIKKWKRCTNCLREGHSIRNCASDKLCKKCNKKHHTLIHCNRENQKTSLIGATKLNEAYEHVFLATAIVELMDKNGKPIKARALLDSGSQVNLMTEKMYNKLGIRYNQTTMKVAGIGKTSTKATKRTIVSMQSIASNFAAKLEVFVLKNITSVQPAQKVNIEGWNISSNVTLADPEFNIPADVDIIIGGELFYKLLTNGLKNIGKGLPDMQNTVFGWVVIGKLLGLHREEAFAGIIAKDTLEEQLTQFWKIEEKLQDKKPLTQLEQECEKFFENTTVRDETGKFKVRLQFINEPSTLGESESMAKRRFWFLEKRFNKDPEMKNDYINFMREYENLGHMEETTKAKMGAQNYFIPHHAVRNPSSSTTKFRVVFDASAKTTTNISLNEILANGPMLQDDLFSIMVRFRKHTYVLSADITKMYRQVLVNEKDQKWQLIVWREDASKPLKTYKLNTLTYGTTCASYLAIKSLQSLANEHKNELPLAYEVAVRDFNVDDIMTGANDLTTATQIQQELIKLCSKANFDLHKWCANHPMLLEHIPKQKQEISLDFNADKTETKALGIKWIPRKDIFKISYDPKEHSKITKRTVLSETAQLYDPLGIVNPIIVLAKIFIQEIWELKLDWDIPLPQNMQDKWKKFREELKKLNEVAFPRRIVMDNAVSTQLHAFSDASTRAYGACFYLRSTDAKGRTEVNLICSKSRVAPVNPITLPRLELCGAVTAVEMVEKLEAALNIKFDETYYWTDSELVLSWIINEGTFKTFVANRVAQILRKTTKQQWKYVNTKANPADLLSRGALPETIINSDLWWNGPEFLRKPKTEWPELKPVFTREPAEERIIKTVLAAELEETHFLEEINHHNSIKFLQKVTAWILRAKSKNTKNKGKALTIEELKEAMTYLVKYAQQKCFTNELELIRKGKGHKTKFTMFTPIIDADGIIRVGGRIKQADIPFEQKHPALLPKDHFITRLIMEQIHIKNKHAGAQALLAITRQKYWPEAGKVLAKKIVKNCVRCVRTKPILMEQIMGELPAERVNIARPFIHVGIDFCGPFDIHYKLRGKKITKGYVCVFVCFTTKAVHLEPAIDQSIDGFINCLKRFIARRGLPKRITSDNATNFRGTNNQLVELADMLDDNQERINDYCRDNEIQWQFAPARSPHFNGLSEAAVKLAKLHMKKILHSVQITYDELGTIVAEIEAILNSRPLTPLSNDPNDLQPLTAGHFLIGAPLTAIDDRQLPYSSKLQTWHKLVALRNEFWKRWSTEYIAELQSKNKWRSEHQNVKEGALVIVKEDNQPPLKWKMGRIREVFKDENEKARVVEVEISSADIEKSRDKKSGRLDPKKLKVNKNVTRRAIHRICPLPTEEQNDKPPEHKVRKVTEVPQINEEPIANRTRSKKGKGSLALFGFMLLAMIVGAVTEKCEYKTFAHSPGLYFENNNKMALSSEKWEILSYIDMQEYWVQQTNLKTILEHMEKICPKMNPQENCDFMVKSGKQQYSGIIAKNSLFREFSHKPLVRKRRGWTFGTSRRNTTVFSRQRRGWANFIGTGLNQVAGVMDDDDAKRINQQLEQFNNTNAHFQEALNNQTSILDMTERIIKRDEVAISKQLTAFKNEILYLENKTSNEKSNLFVTLALQFKTLLGTHTAIQNTLSDLVTQMHEGKVSAAVLAPDVLKQQIKIISGQISNEVMVPGDGTPQHIATLYSLMSASVRINTLRIIMKITVPLISRDIFDLHHIIPVPFKQGMKTRIIDTKHQYIAINKRQDRYYMLTKEQKLECKKFTSEFIICEQVNILFNTQQGNANCEMAILTHLSKGIPPKCNLNLVNANQTWSKLLAANQFIFTVKDRTALSIICKTKSSICFIEGTGIIQVPTQCVLQTSNMEIVAENTYKSELSIVMAPAINISDVLSKEAIKEHKFTPQEFQVDPELEILEEAINKQKEAEKFIPHFNYHNIHHYSLIYIIIGTTIGIIIWLACMNQRKEQRTSTPIEMVSIQRPIAVPRATIQDIQFP